MWLVVSLACVPSPSKSPSESDSGTPTGVVAAELPAPQWDAVTVTSRAQAMLDLGFPSAHQIVFRFTAKVDEGSDGVCPNGANYTITESFAGCESSKGYRFAGLSIYQVFDANNFSLLGDCYITDPEGLTFFCAGELEMVTENGVKTTKMTGTWGHPGESDPWLAAVPSLALWVEETDTTTVINGGWGATWPVGGDLTQVYLKDLTRTSACITGTVMLRDPGGSWYVLENPECGSVGELCGTWVYDRSELGTGCLDFSHLGAQ